MRFVGHDQIVVGVQNVEIERDGRLVGHGAVVPDEFVVGSGGGGRDDAAVIGYDFVVINALGDRVVGQMREAGAQEIHDGGVGAGGDAQSGWSDTVAHGEWGSGHESSLGPVPNRIGCGIETGFDEVGG